MKLRTPEMIGLLFMIGTLPGYSQTLNWGSLTNSTIMDSHGQTLDETFVFQLGAFESGFVPDEVNVGSWDTMFRVFDTASYTYNSVDLAYFTGTRNVRDVPAYSSMFEGLKAYVLIRNAANTEFFLATTESTSEWVFPALDPQCCPTGITTWSVSDLEPDTPVFGGHDDKRGGGIYVAPGPYDLQTHAIPEPGAPVIAMFGLAVSLLRRRRKVG